MTRSSIPIPYSMDDLTLLLLSILAAAVPTLVYVGLIYWVDRYEKEPLWLLTAAFLWGAIPSIIAALIFNTLFSVPLYLLAGDAVGEVLAASLIAPPVEESLKGLALLFIFFFWRNEIDSVLDGIIYGAMVGMGFAMVENVFYFVGVYMEGGAEAWGINIVLRGVIFGLNHALFSSMTGLGIAIARMTTNPLLRVLAPIGGWATAVFLHFLHNAAVSTSSLLCFVALLFDWGGVLLTLLIIVWALVQEKSWLKTYLAEEVALGLLTTRQYETAVSGRKRSQYLWKRLSTHGLNGLRTARRFYHQCSKLAYKKHHFALFKDEASARAIQQLRSEIATLSRAMA